MIGLTVSSSLKNHPAIGVPPVLEPPMHDLACISRYVVFSPFMDCDLRQHVKIESQIHIVMEQPSFVNRIQPGGINHSS